MGQGKKLNEFLALLQTGAEQSKGSKQVFGDAKDLDTKLSQTCSNPR